MTYMVGDTQYVAVAAGYGGAELYEMADDAAARFYANQGRMLVFKLDGGQTPLPPKLAKPKGPPVVDTSAMPPAAPELLARGAQVYGRCIYCHGYGGSTSVLPNLERANELGFDGVHAIIMEGALEPMGMPNFGGRMSEDDFKALYAYISRGLENKPADYKWY